MTIETKRRVAKGLQLGLVVGVLVGLSGLIQTAWLADPIPALAQTVTVDSTQSPIVVNAVADLADLTPSDGQSVIIKTGTEKGLWYYDKDSVTATGVSVLNGPGSVGRFLVINNDAGSVAAATAITAAEITNDSLLELQAFDGSAAKSLTLEELKKTGIQVVNVKQHGAVGNGVADDTAEIQAASDTGAKVIYVPAGTYLVSTIDIETNDQVWIIEGTVKQKVLATTVGPPIFNVDASRVTFTGPGTIDGDKSNQPADTLSDSYANGSGYGRSYRCAIEFDSQSPAYTDLKVDGLTFKNLFGCAIAVHSANGVTVRNCKHQDSNFELLFVANTTGSEVTDYEIVNNRLSNIGTGDGSVNSDGIVMVDVKRVRIQGNQAYDIERNFVKFETDIQDTVISGNVVDTITVQDFFAFQFQGAANRVTLASNTVRSAPGLVNFSTTTASSTDVHITGNICTCGGAVSASSDAIRVTGGQNRITIANNTISEYKRYGLYVSGQSGGDINNLVVRGNTFTTTLNDSCVLLDLAAANINVSFQYNKFTDIASSATDQIINLGQTLPYRLVDFEFVGNRVDTDAITHRAFYLPVAFAYSGTCRIANNFFGGVVLTHGTIPAKVYTADNTTDVLTSVAHGFLNGDMVYLTTTGAQPTGLSLATKYFVINKTADTFQLSATKGGAAVLFSDDGSGTNTATGILAIEVDNTNVIMGITQIPSQGTAAPARPPIRIGETYIDTSAGKVYIATGDTTVAGFKIQN